MPPPIATTEPTSIRAGDLIEWEKDLPDYPANDGWTLTYTLIHPTNQKITLTTVASGAKHLVSVPAATSAAYTAGQYQWMGRVVKAAAVYTIGTGTLDILPNLATATVFDFRSHAKKMLDAIQAAYEGRATWDQLEYEIKGRRIRSMTASELIAWLTYYQREVANEKAAEQLGKTGIDPRRIGVRLQRV